jgi:hypothetical protein
MKPRNLQLGPTSDSGSEMLGDHAMRKTSKTPACGREATTGLTLTRLR